jgi:hypothetical protein
MIIEPFQIKRFINYIIEHFVIPENDILIQQSTKSKIYIDNNRNQRSKDFSLTFPELKHLL